MSLRTPIFFGVADFVFGHLKSSQKKWDFRSDDGCYYIDLQLPTLEIMCQDFSEISQPFFFSENHPEAADGRNSAPPGMHETL